jgi:hypothetical protein
MNFYEVIATHRSGHHSMMNWVIKNLCGFQCTWEYKMNILNDSGLYQLNCANHDIPVSFNLYKDFQDKYKELIVSYEDTFWDYTIWNESQTYQGKLSLKLEGNTILNYKRIIFIRDFYNNLASRVKANENQNFKTFEEKQVVQFDVAGKFIERWKNQAKACVENKVSYLKFEDWISSPEKRKQFLFNITGLDEVYTNDNIIGTHSSFKDSSKDLNNRINQVNLPESTKELIRKDNELHYLMGALGYEYKEI